MKIDLMTLSTEFMRNHYNYKLLYQLMLPRILGHSNIFLMLMNDYEIFINIFTNSQITVS